MKEITTFYRFSNNTFHGRGFTWAASIYPRSEMIDRFCSECGAVENYPSGAFDVLVEGGSKYPDILGCGAYPFLIVTEPVVMAWQKEGITCFHTYPVGIAKVKSRKLQGVLPPRYLRVEIDGRCKIDLTASGVDVIRICPECHRVIERPKYPFEHGYRMETGSWDGCALFRDPILYPRVSFCTHAILELARQHRFTNFRFELMDKPPDPTSNGIDYLK